MRVNQKTIKRFFVLSLFLGLNFFAIYTISSVYTYFNTGANRKNALHIELENNDYYLPKINWYELNNEGRYLNDQTIGDLEKGYRNAWYVKKYALANNNPDAFLDFYTDSARMNLKKTVAFNSKEKIKINSSTLEHNIEVIYFSEDGQLLFIKDHDVVEYTSYYKNQKLIHQNKTKSDYEVVMLLEDGFWRIRHLIKKNEAPLTNLAAQTKPQHKTSPIKGINYYPKDYPWLAFWEKFDKDIVIKDFKIIKDLGLNSVRIFIPYEAFGKYNVASKKLQHLKTVLDVAQQQNLKVIVTLFDFYSDYSVLDYSLCDTHIEQIINTTKGHPALLQYDIKNEPDLDFKFRKKEKVINWLSFVIDRIKERDITTPVTIGWYDAKNAHLLEQKVDVVSFHYYKKPSKFIETYNTLKAKTTKPIVLQEYGKHSYNSFWFPFSNTESTQALYYQKMQEQFSQLGNINYISWTLYDFPEIDASVFGRIPWRTNPQKNYGIINTNGDLKEVSKFLTSSNKNEKISFTKRISNFYFFIVIFIITSCITLKYTLRIPYFRKLLKKLIPFKRSFIYRYRKTNER